MCCGDVLNQIEYGDFLIDECDGLIQRYDDWNAEVRSLHDRNSHLYFREIRIHEPPPCERRTNVRASRTLTNCDAPIDPLPVTLDQIDFHIQHSDVNSLAPTEVVRFRSNHTVAHYRERRKHSGPDPSLTVNQIRLHGPDEVTAHVNEIPNLSSQVGSDDAPANRRIRQMRMRQTAFETAQSARADRPLKIPKELRAIAFEEPPKTPPFPKLKVFRDHRETKKKIQQLETAFHESLASSARRIRNRNIAAASQRIRGSQADGELWAQQPQHRKPSAG
jgi:hypothetical protein